MIIYFKRSIIHKVIQLRRSLNLKDFQLQDFKPFIHLPKIVKSSTEKRDNLGYKKTKAGKYDK